MRDENALSHGNVAALIERFGDLRLLVLGDVMLDEYRSGDVSRTSPEAPVPVVKVHDEHQCLGGAANVANLARALGAEVELFGVIGNDAAGERFTSECARLGIESGNLVRTHARPTTRKLRVLAQHQQVLRLDWEEERPISGELTDEVLRGLRNCERPDVIIVSDYAKGFLTPEVLDGVMTRAKEWGVPVLVDPKYADLSRYRGATVIKANLKEFEASVGHRVLDDLVGELDRGGAALMDDADIDALVVTLGERGLAICERGRVPDLMPTSARDVYDVSGAGDAVITVLGLGLALDVDIRTAARLANEAAGIAVGKSGVAVVEPEELAARFIHSARDKVISGEELESRVAWWRVQKQKVVFTNGCFDLLHVGHLHVLRQAAALGDVLLVAVNSDDSVRRLKGETRPLIDENDRTALLAALDCVDAVVVFDEDTPLELIEAVRPHVLVKGGDYERDQVVGHDVIEAWGGTVELVPLLPGHSTTNLVDRIRSETPSSRPPDRT
jgi:D-beta-D-heptose 7-phosphate kinase/D-beta-D-heptose 1-phosphate adenosyltransferase